MQIQVPFFTTFRFYNPDARLIFFTNLRKEELPSFLIELFDKTNAEIVTVPYKNKPPKGWYKAWMNQYYLYDILLEMEKRMKDDDTLLVCDADCLCRKPLQNLFEDVRKQGASLYKMGYPRNYVLNGTSIEQMEEVYEGCYGEKKRLNYYGGEFIALRGDNVRKVNREFQVLSKYNFAISDGHARLHEEAHNMSVIAAHLDICVDTGNKYVKRLWTWNCHNVESGDENLYVWHMPAEKKTGLYRLYKLLQRQGGIIDERKFWKKASAWCGIPKGSLNKTIHDIWLRSKSKLRLKLS